MGTPKNFTKVWVPPENYEVPPPIHTRPQFLPLAELPLWLHKSRAFSFSERPIVTCGAL